MARFLGEVLPNFMHRRRSASCDPSIVQTSRPGVQQQRPAFLYPEDFHDLDDEYEEEAEAPADDSKPSGSTLKHPAIPTEAKDKATAIAAQTKRTAGTMAPFRPPRLATGCPGGAARGTAEGSKPRAARRVLGTLTARRWQWSTTSADHGRLLEPQKSGEDRQGQQLLQQLPVEEELRGSSQHQQQSIARTSRSRSSKGSGESVLPVFNEKTSTLHVDDKGTEGEGEEEEEEEELHIGVDDEEEVSMSAGAVSSHGDGKTEESRGSQGEDSADEKGAPETALAHMDDQKESYEGAQEEPPLAAAAAATLMQETGTGICGSSCRRPDGDGGCVAVDEGAAALSPMKAEAEHCDKGDAAAARAAAAMEEEDGEEERDQEKEKNEEEDEEMEEEVKMVEAGPSGSSGPPHAADGRSSSSGRRSSSPKDKKQRRGREYLASLHRQSHSAEEAADEDGEPYFGPSLGSITGAPKRSLQTLSSSMSGGYSAPVDDEAAAPAYWKKRQRRPLSGATTGYMGIKGEDDDAMRQLEGDTGVVVGKEEEEPGSGGGASGSPGGHQGPDDAGASDPFDEDAISLLMTQIPIAAAAAAAAAQNQAAAPWCLFSSSSPPSTTPAAAEGEEEGGEKHAEPEASLPRTRMALSAKDIEENAAAEKKDGGGDAAGGGRGWGGPEAGPEVTGPFGLQDSSASQHHQDIRCEEHKDEGAENNREADIKNTSGGYHQAPRCWNDCANEPRPSNEAPPAASHRSFNCTASPEQEDACAHAAAPTPAVLIPGSSVAGSQAVPSEAASQSLGAQLWPHPTNASQQQETHLFPDDEAMMMSHSMMDKQTDDGGGVKPPAGAAAEVKAPGPPDLQPPSVTTSSFSEGGVPAADGSEALQLSQRPQHSRDHQEQEVNLDSPSNSVTHRSISFLRNSAGVVVPVPPVKRQRLLPTPKKQATRKAAEGHSQQQLLMGGQREQEAMLPRHLLRPMASMQQQNKRHRRQSYGHAASTEQGAWEATVAQENYLHESEMPYSKTFELLPKSEAVTPPVATAAAAAVGASCRSPSSSLLIKQASLWSSRSIPQPLHTHTHTEEEEEEEETEEGKTDEDGQRDGELKAEQEPSQIASTPPVPSSWPDPWEDFGGNCMSGEAGCRAGWEAADGSLVSSPMHHDPYPGCGYYGGGDGTEQLSDIVWRGKDTALLMGPPSPQLVTAAMEAFPMPSLDSAWSPLLIFADGPKQQQQQQEVLRGYHRDAAKGVRALSRTAGLRKTANPLSSASSPLSSAPSTSSYDQKFQGSGQNPLGPSTQSLMLELQDRIIPKLTTITVSAAAASSHTGGSSRGRGPDVAQRISLLLLSMGIFDDLPEEHACRDDSHGRFWQVEDDLKLPTMMQKQQPHCLAMGDLGFSPDDELHNGIIVSGRSCSSLPCHKVSSSATDVDFGIPPCCSSITEGDPLSSTRTLDATAGEPLPPAPSDVNFAQRDISIDSPEARSHQHQEATCLDDVCLEDPGEMRRRAQRGFSGLRFSAERLRQVRSMLL